MKKNKIAEEGKHEILEPQTIYEDSDILVIEKPSGLLVHARGERLLDQEPTLVDWLIKKYPAVKKVGDQPKLRPGLVHRLDKEASGVMVIAKTQRAFAHLKKQFADQTVKKEYYAWIYGKLATDYGMINFPIGRAEKGGKMAARPLNSEENKRQEGKEAKTEYEVLESHPHRSLLKVFPKTGRTHQIRVHLSALNHPLIGDPLYRSKSYKIIPSSRLLLHAHKLTLKDLNDQEQTFTSPLPKIFDWEK